MNTDPQKAWREGYDLGVKTALIENDKAIQIGRAIMDVLYNTFETLKEDY